MSKQPRKHHYVPQFYLTGFTDDGSSNGNLSVLDTARLKSWAGKPKDVAHQRDFHEIDGGPHVDPMIIEKLLANYEGEWSVVLRDVMVQQRVPNDDRYGDLMMFIAFMAVRVPRIRNRIDRFLEDVRRNEEFARNWLRQQGDQVEPASENEAEESKQTWHVQQMIRMAVTLAPILSLRTWQLWIAGSGASDFICSDSPVALTWAIPATGPYPPGFGLKNTVVTIPLNKRIAMVGMFDIDVGRRTLETHEVARLNSATGMQAEQLYSSAPDFVWLMKNGALGGRADLLDAFRAIHSEAQVRSA